MLRSIFATTALICFSVPALAQEQNRQVSQFKAPDDIEFRTADIISEGVRMSAELFSPQGATGKLPTIVMSHGWGGTAASLRPDATAFAREGFLVVTFDYRGWGSSDARLIKAEKPLIPIGNKFLGEIREVRGVVDPIDQTTDILNALHWVRDESLCDPDRIGIWGSSYSGGHVVYVAARDASVKAFVSQVGAMDSRFMLEDPAVKAIAISEASARARGESGYPKPFARYGGLTGQPIWEKLMHYAPIEDIDRTEKCAKLFIIAENEELFDNEDHAIAAHDKAPGVKKLVTLTGIKHYGVYMQKRKEAQQLAIDWYKEHL